MQIEALWRAGHDIPAIAELIGRHRTTVWRELRRNHSYRHGSKNPVGRRNDRPGGRPVIGPPPAIRNRHTDLVRRRRSWWRMVGFSAAALAALLRLAGARGRR